MDLVGSMKGTHKLNGNFFSLDFRIRVNVDVDMNETILIRNSAFVINFEFLNNVFKGNITNMSLDKDNNTSKSGPKTEKSKIISKAVKHNGSFLHNSSFTRNDS